LLLEAEGLQAKFKSLRLVHVNRDFNAAADYISKRVIQEQSSLEVTDLGERKLLQGLNPFVTTRSRSEQSNAAEESATESGTDHLESVDPGADESGTDGAEEGLAVCPQNPDSQDPEEDPEDVRRERWRRTCSHQAHDPGLAPLVKFLRGETERLSLRQTTHLAKKADQFVLDSQDALFYVSQNTPERPRDTADRLRLVVPQDLQEDILHHCHAGFQGAHQGIIRTYERLRKEFYWIGMFKDAERYVKECVDCVTCVTAKGCAFSGFIMCKAMASTEAQDVAEAYEECVFRRFGASEMIRHDRDPRFMGQQERSVQTVIRSVKAYVQTLDQSDWDELAERLMWAVNTSFDFTRLDTPFYLVHGWDAQGTVEAMMGDFPRDVQLRDAQEWRTKIQRQLTDRLKEGFEVGDSVWLYLARVRPGLTKKLAHLWHGPFRILGKGSDYRYRLHVEGTEYRFYPWVDVSRLKPRAKYPDRPSEPMDIPEDDDFDAALLREDSWEPDEGSGEFEVEAILDVRWVTRTRTSRRVKEYQVKWKGYEAPDWVPQGHLNCGRLLYEFDQGERARARFQAMQSGDELPDEEAR
ncbi:reverse transcriptase, partial [Phytophthora megakarya]